MFCVIMIVKYFDYLIKAIVRGILHKNETLGTFPVSLYERI